MELQIILNTFAIDVFRKQGDFDYIAARSNFKLQLRQQFLWSAQQSIEKYLKAILLFNGKSARYVDINKRKKEYGHDICLLVSSIKNINAFPFDFDLNQERFIKYISEQGPNRYIGTTAYNTMNVLEELDSTVWHIRRYCQYMDDRGFGCKQPVLGMREASIAAALNPSHKLQPHKFTLFNGQLEAILKKPKTDPARKALIWANLFYGSKKIKKATYTTFSSAEIPPNERDWPNINWAEIEKYIRL